MNTIPEFWCYSCFDFGQYPIHDRSTDAILYWKRCKDCTWVARHWKFNAERDWRMSAKELADAPPF
jgi:hypothetical protein